MVAYFWSDKFENNEFESDKFNLCAKNKLVTLKLVIQKIHSLYVYNAVLLHSAAAMYCSTVLLYNVQLHLHYLMLQQYYYMNSMLFHVIIYATDCNKHCSYSSAESKSLTACDLQADIKIYSTAVF